MVNHQRNEIDGSCFVLKFRIDPIYVVSEIVWFLYFGVLAWNYLFMPTIGEFGGLAYILPNDVIYRLTKNAF